MTITSPTQDLSTFIEISNSQPVTNSRQVAIAFGKRHDDVLRKLRSINCSNEFNARNFAEVKYKDTKGEYRPAYEMTKDGFIFLVMGFTGKKADELKEAYINAFNAMAEQLLSQPQFDQLCLQLPDQVNIHTAKDVARTVCFHIEQASNVSDEEKQRSQSAVMALYQWGMKCWSVIDNISFSASSGRQRIANLSDNQVSMPKRGAK